MAYVITPSCTKDELCVEACPVDCIHPKKDAEGFEGAAQLFIDPVECIDCGACVPVCPVQAIFALEDVPDDQKSWVDVNADKAAGLPVINTKLDPLPTAEEKKKQLGL